MASRSPLSGAHKPCPVQPGLGLSQIRERHACFPLVKAHGRESADDDCPDDFCKSPLHQAHSKSTRCSDFRPAIQAVRLVKTKGRFRRRKADFDAPRGSRNGMRQDNPFNSAANQRFRCQAGLQLRMHAGGCAWHSAGYNAWASALLHCTQKASSGKPLMRQQRPTLRLCLFLFLKPHRQVSGKKPLANNRRENRVPARRRLARLAQGCSPRRYLRLGDRLQGQRLPAAPH